MHLHLFHEIDSVGRPHGCSYIRLLQPFSHPSLPPTLTVTSGEALPHKTPDIAMIERLWLPGLRVEHAERQLEILARRNVPFIYTLDDNLLDLNLMPGLKEFPTDEQRQVIRLLAQEACGIIVSTEPLAARMRRFNDRVAVVPNQLDERLFPPRPMHSPRQEGVTFGYMGTLSHLEDVMMILKPLRRVMRRYGSRLRFEVVGIAEPVRILSLFPDLPVECHTPARKQMEYPAFTRWVRQELRWDFAIAPLQDTAFNASKSDLKYLDYAILGIPGIFSATPSYRDTIRHRDNGLLVANNDNDWEDGLTAMIEDTALRQGLAQRAEADVRATRTLAQHAVRWVEAVESLASRAAAAA